MYSFSSKAVFSKKALRITIASCTLPLKCKKPIPPPYTLRRYFSSSAMISIARILGAPLSVPAGNTAPITSKSDTSLRLRPYTSVTMCITCSNCLMCIIFFTCTVPFSAKRPISLRAKSTSIRCSEHSLGSARSSCAKRASSLASLPRGRVPAIGAIYIVSELISTNISGLDPTTSP